MSRLFLPAHRSSASSRPAHDQRIAVVAVDISSPSTITTRLYVEDLVGRGHHSDIYSASASRVGTPTILWPMGWHQGNLVLALVPACTSDFPKGPTEWHVSSPVTAGRVATIKATNCQMSIWPSPAGVACAQPSGPTTLFDWNGKVIGGTGPGPGIDLQVSSAIVSPAGRSVYFSGGGVTGIDRLGPGPYTTVQGHDVCGWIDEDHLLSTDAVIRFPAETPGNLEVAASTAALPQSAQPVPPPPKPAGAPAGFPASSDRYTPVAG